MTLAVIERLGDVIAVTYPEEQDVALFIAGSAEVLVCSAEDWQALKSAGGHSDPPKGVDQVDDLTTQAPAGLRVLLAKLGASIS